MPTTEPIESTLTSASRMQARRVRLLISIPTLIFLVTLGTGYISYQILLRHAQLAGNREAVDRIEDAALDHLKGSIALSLIAGGIGLLVALQIVRPIRELTRTARRVVHGDLTGRLRVPDLGELADLGTSFNQMVDHLQRIFRERNRILEGSEGASVVWLDLSGRVKSMDASNSALFSLPVEALIGRSVFDLVPDVPANQEVTSLLRREIVEMPSQRLTSYIVEVQLDPEGPPMLLGITLALMRDETGNPSGYLMTLRDLNSLRSFHEQMMRADRLAALGTFAAGMAHEVRNPLASIKGMVQLMGESESPDDMSTYVDRIVKEIARLEKLLTEVMNFAHPEKTEPETTDLNRLVRESLEVAVSHCEPEDHEIGVRTEFSTLPPCVVEPRRIHQALVNVIINAFEATPPGGEVVIRTEMLSDQENEVRPLVISVLNSGDAVPADQRERIFEPFHTTKPAGTGLGLPIAYQIVAAHRGVLELDHLDGKTCFRIALPEVPLSP